MEIKDYSFKGIKFKSHNNLDKDLEIMQGYFEKYTPKKADIVLDCGSYVGCFTIIASKLVGAKGKVIAFEPDATSYRKLLANIELNKLTNVKAINKGVFDKNSKKEFYERTSRGSSFVFESEGMLTKSVDVTTIDNVVKELNLEKIDFIKMDVEGAELQALKGTEKILKTLKPNLAIATYHIIDGKTTDNDVEKYLQKLKYKTVTGFMQHRVTYAWK
jgi:FkbM family methyltransferase